ncbi:hypothetical protein [Bacteroides bouchesdurhonensis]|uniref:hypothetical protein n=1 Tax=Bacteroides bouchesdurhonensis TaxID=1841855 RepID=UPI0011DDC51C|nr:hypothetical protein [Bacteroides bouchesdurhonensis]
MKKILFCILVIYSSVSLTAQNATNSPTSMFGLGEVSTGEGGQYAGLGGMGIALRGNTFLNNANPASLTELSGQRFQFDAGIMGAYQSYTQRGSTNHSVIGNLNNLSIGCRILPHWYGAAFLAPVSSVGYAITLDESISGTNGSTVSSLFQGEGGLSKIGISTAYLLGKNLSIGTNLSYVTGTITQTEIQGSSTEETSSYKNTFYADFGIQYKWAIDREHSFVVGGVYGYSQNFKQDNNLHVSSTSGDDTIEKKLKHDRQCLPQFFGIGASYNCLRWMATIDYKYIDWSRMQSSRSNVSFDNQHKLSIGGKYTLGNVYRNRVSLLLGTGINNSSVVIQKKKATNYYFSTGMNLQLQDNNVISIGLKYKGQMKTPNGMQRENSLSLFLNITFSERTYRPKIQ